VSLLKTCVECGKTMPRGHFEKKMGRRNPTTISRCRACERPYRKARAHARAERSLGRGTFTATEVRQIGTNQGWLCAYCQINIGLVGYHVDHVVPLSKGGMNTADNLQLLCGPCNMRKAAKLPHEMGKLRKSAR
jgi:5-methylcytosine-specific restriction endonuclease McrA